MDENNVCSKLIKFLIEQLLLNDVAKPHYSSDVLLWAAMIFYTNPSAYRLIRNSELLTLPHPMYLKKLSMNSGMLISGFSSSHNEYLKKNYFFAC